MLNRFTTLIIVFFVIGFMGANSQEPRNFYEIQSEMYQYFKDKDTTEKGKGWKQFKRWEWFWEQRVGKSGEFPNPMHLYLESVKHRNIENKKDKLLSDSWEHKGPETSPGGYAGLGRLNAVQVDHSNSDIIWVGSASGGLWHTTDGGSNWDSDTDNLPTLGISDIEIDPDNSSIMYIATGDVDARDTYSVGVLKSTNGGNSWNTTGLNWNTTNTRTVGRIHIHPTDSDILYAATSNGVYKTTDAGSSWSLLLTGNFKDMELKPGDPSTIYVSGTTIYRSTDNGSNWSQLTSGLPSSNVARIAIAVSPADEDYIYALYARGDNRGLLGVYLSTNSGTSWSQKTGTSPNLLGWMSDGSDAGGQGTYDLSLEVDPDDETKVYVGGVNVHRSVNSGSSWTCVAMWTSYSGYNLNGADEVHADHHMLHWDQYGRLMSCHDGGIDYTTNGGSSWTYIGSGIHTTQFYKFGVSESDNWKIIGGSQDNGTKLLNGSSWSDEIGGDGMECIIHPTNSDIMYGSLYYGQIRRTTNDGASWSTITGSLSGRGYWVTPYVLDPDNASKIVVGFLSSGTTYIYQSTNSGTNWSTLSSFYANGYYPNVIRYAPSNNDYMYVSNFYYMRRSTNGGSSWSTITLPYSGYTLTDIAVDDADPNNIWISYSGYSSTNKVFYSTNGGSSWNNISGDLPNVPINCVYFFPGSNDRVFVGTDIGVWYTDDNSTDWTGLNQGLPNVIVNELDYHSSTQTLRAATYGRGIWSVNFSDVSKPVLASPSDGATDVSTSVALSWYSVTGADSYNVQVSTESDFSTLEVNAFDITSESYQCSDLQEGTQHYWKVQAESSQFTSDWSEVWDFSTSGTPPVYYCSATASTCDEFIDRFQFAGIDNLSGCGLVNGYSDYTNISAPDIIRGAEYEIDVNNGNGYPSDYCLVWVDWNRDGDFDDADETISFDDLPNSGPYQTRIQVPQSAVLGETRLRVRINWASTPTPCGNTQYGEIEDYTVNVVSGNVSLSTPSLITPTNGDTEVPLSPYFDWSTVTNAWSYDMQVSKTNTFATTVFDENVDMPKLTIHGYVTDPSTVHYWRIRARNGVFTSAWSPKWSFTTDKYCSAYGKSTDSYFISNVAYGTVTNGTSKDYYEWFDAHTSYFDQNESFDVDVTQNNSSGTYYCGIWCDWNQDGDFIDADEYIGQSGGTGNFIHTVTVNVPINASLGKTRMRIRLCADAGNLLSCGSTNYGEVEDYNLFIEPYNVPAPTLSSPSNGATDVTLNTDMQWSPVTYADRYHLMVDNNSDFSSPEININNVNVASYSVSSLDDNTQYWWKVRAGIGSNWGSWSSSWNYTLEEQIYSVPASWDFADNTGSSSTIVVPASINPDLGRNIENGDAIGLFFDDTGTLKCAGYEIWDGNNMSITAWGDDAGTVDKDGFDDNETYQYKFWDAKLGMEIPAQATYETGSSSDFIDGTTSTLASLDASSVIQNISISNGWNMISAYVDPLTPNMATLFTNLVDNDKILIVKNGDGAAYIPGFSNGIGNWNVKKGYQVYGINGGGTLNIQGYIMNPQTTTITLGTGWDIYSYLRTSSMAAATALDGVKSNMLICKNNEGQAYLPQFPPPNDGIQGGMQAGQGYQIYMLNEDDLNYPANNKMPARSDDIKAPTAELLMPAESRTGNNATVVIKLIGEFDNREIAIVNNYGKIIGAGKVSGGSAIIPVWGDNIMTQEYEGATDGELLQAMLYDHKTGAFESLHVKAVRNMLDNSKSSALMYEKDGFFVVDVESLNQDNSLMIQNIPNPMSNTAVIEYNLPGDGDYSIELFNLQGVKVVDVDKGSKNAGSYRLDFNSSSLASGAYTLILRAGQSRAMHMLYITK